MTALLDRYPWALVPIVVLAVVCMSVRFRPGVWLALCGLVCRAFEWVVAEYVTGEPVVRRPASTPRRDELDRLYDLTHRAPEDGGLTVADWAWLADVAGWQPAIDQRASTPTVPTADDQVVEWRGDVGLGCMGRDSLVKRRPSRGDIIEGIYRR